jgi:hypothetical protein
VLVDVDSAAARIAAGRYPNSSEWATEYVVHPHGDVAAPEAFTAIIAADASAAGRAD